MDEEVVRVVVQSTWLQNFLWPFLSSLAGVFVSLLGAYALYRLQRSQQDRTERARMATEAKDANRRAWSTIIFEVGENWSRLKWLADNALVPQLAMLKKKVHGLIPLMQYRLRTSAVDMGFADGTIKHVGDLGFQVRLKNQREQCVDLNLMLEHIDRFAMSNHSLSGFGMLEDLYNQQLNTTRRARLSLERIFDDLNTDGLRPAGQGRLVLGDIESGMIEKAKILDDESSISSGE